MKLSTKGRYGMRVMLDLALRPEGPVSVKEISRRQRISEVYLEQILTQLKVGGLVKSSAGPKGGFMLSREPDETSLKDILEATEGANSLVDCVKDASACPRSDACLTRRLWTAISKAMDQVLSASLQDLINGRLTLAEELFSENMVCHNPIDLGCLKDRDETEQDSID
jgi:Rrf2 family cysteine metabolism transcriptional repressor